MRELLNMMPAADADIAIAERCAALGLTRSQAQALADAQPFPTGVLQVLGLNPETFAPLPTKSWLRMAAETSSVSYQGNLTSERLLSVLVSGNIPSEFHAHMIHFLGEAPMQIVVMAVEQASQKSGKPIVAIWGNVVKLCTSLRCSRFAGARISTVGL